MMQTIIIILCVIIGVLAGCFIYEKDIWASKLQQASAKNDAIRTLEEEKAGFETLVSDLEGQIGDLKEEVSKLNEDIRLLKETVTLKEQEVAEKEQKMAGLTAELEKQFLPTIFPLTSGRAIEEQAEGEEPICVFTVAEGSMVVATAAGTVRFVNEDPEYGYNIWVDHGNGYTTIYRCRGDVKVKKGEVVTQGATLLLITEQDSRLGYQMMRDNEYMDPMDMLEISG